MKLTHAAYYGLPEVSEMPETVMAGIWARWDDYPEYVFERVGSEWKAHRIVIED
jgi:hypothetical protein